MYAVVEAGGRQYRVSAGDVLEVDRLEATPGDEVTFGRVLALAREGEFVIGEPTVPGVRVEARVLSQRRQRKIDVFKYKSKVNYRRRFGHRQPITQILVLRLAGAGEGADEVAQQVAGEAAAPAAQAPAQKAGRRRSKPADVVAG